MRWSPLITHLQRRFYILTSENRNDAVTRRGTEIVSGGPPAAPFP
jgi:hypothetical protein